MSERFLAKREAGISPLRRDGSLTSEETDRQAAGAERFAAERFGAEYNEEVYAEHGDGGADFYLGGRSIEVVWLGVEPDGRPRRDGHLIVNPDEPQRHADLYVVVAGSIEAGFTLLGWLPHGDLVERPLKNFGYGPKHAAPVICLRWFRPEALAPVRG